MTDTDEAVHDAGAIQPVGTVLYESERARVIRCHRGTADQGLR